MPTNTVKTGWLKDANGDEFAPKTLTSQVQTDDGRSLEDKIQEDINTAVANLSTSSVTKEAFEDLAAKVESKANITDIPAIPVNVSELTNDVQYQTAADLAPTIIKVDTLEAAIAAKADAASIPTVNNATLTIQKNGTNVATFTANSASSATANITVPTGAAADKGVDTSISAASTSTNLPTSEAVAAFVEGKGYKTTDNNTTYTIATGDLSGQIKVTPSSGSAYNVSVKGLGSAAYATKGVANGVAELDANGKVPSAQLPSFVMMY